MNGAIEDQMSPAKSIFYNIYCDESCHLKSDGIFVPWTAYPVEREHTQDKLIKPYESWKKQGSPLPGTP